MKDPNARERMLRGQAIANDPQPFRCVVCGTAVSHINPGKCKCLDLPDDYVEPLSPEAFSALAQHGKKSMKKGRQPTLTPDEVTKARWLYANTDMSISALALRFGVSPSTMSHVIGRTKGYTS